MKKKKLPKWNGRPELWASDTFHNVAIIWGRQPGQVEMGNAVDFNPLIGAVFSWSQFTTRKALHCWGWQKIGEL